MKALIFVFRDGSRRLFGFVPLGFNTGRHGVLSRGSYCMRGIERLEERDVFSQSLTVH